MNSSFTQSQRSALVAAVAFFAICVVFLQTRIDPLRRQPAIEPANLGTNITRPIGSTGAALPFEYILGAMTGFRQVIAGLLWVRSDTFFHEGNYDAILPCIRLITWLDPNWLDPYATGAWHLMYNFTDTDQRSDRRYLPAGVALLKEGIANNPNQYDMYKELGWNNYDKIKDFDASAAAYADGIKNDPKFDVTQVEHALAHCYEKTGQVDKAIATWEDCVKRHKAIVDDKTSTPDDKARNQQGYENSLKNLFIDEIRAYHRKTQTQPPVDVEFTARVVRTKPKVLEISGQWNLVGSKDFDAGPLKNQKYDLAALQHITDYGKGILKFGPVDGARVDVRLQDAGYQMPTPSEFSFDVDPKVTIMQDSLSTRGGKVVAPGGVYIWRDTPTYSLGPDDNQAGVYAFDKTDGANPGVPLDKALAGGAPIGPEGQKQLEIISHESFGQLKADPAKIATLVKQGYGISTQSRAVLGKFKREIDMSKDPKMYGFSADKYDLILSINPRTCPDFVQDRIGWEGEGWTDKRYLDTKTLPGVRMIRQQIELNREDLTGSGTKVLLDDGPSK